MNSINDIKNVEKPEARTIVLQKLNDSLELVQPNLPLSTLYIDLINKLEKCVQTSSVFLNVLIEERKYVTIGTTLNKKFDFSQLLKDLDILINILLKDLNKK